jgi:hypothetical protein
VAQINVRGDGFRVELLVGGYESESRGESYDDNWLRGSVAVTLAQPPTATFSAGCDVAWQTSDLLRFQESLRTLLEDLTGVATLSTLEDQVELTIRLDAGKGTLEGRVEAHAIASLSFEGATDQSFLRQTLAELRAVTAAYPFRTDRR